LVVLLNYVAAQMLTQEINESINISSILENLTEVSEVSEITEITETGEVIEISEEIEEKIGEGIEVKVKEELEVNITQKNIECQLRYECRPRGDYFYYDCYFDENISDCRCFVGLFSRCNLEASNLSIIAKPTIRERFRMAYIKDKLKPIMPLLRLARRVLYNWRTGVVGVLVVLIALIVFYAYNRDTPSNNLRKARGYHKKAQRLYEKRKYEKAEKYYELAEEYRKRVKEF